MLQTIMTSEATRIILLVLGGIGIFMEILLGIKYGGVLRKTGKIGTEKYDLTENIRKKYELCHRMNMNVNNVDNFVDKYVYKQKFMGITLCTWEIICGQLCSLIGGIAVVACVCAVGAKCGQDVISQYIVQAGASITMLITFWKVGNLSTKKQLIHLNLCDYLENIYQIRLEKESVNPEWSLQYRKEMEKLEEKAKQEKMKKSRKNDKRSEIERMKAELVEELKQERLENEKRRLEEKQSAEKAQQLLKEKEIYKKEEKNNNVEQTKFDHVEEIKSDVELRVENNPEEERILQDILREYLG